MHQAYAGWRHHRVAIVALGCLLAATAHADALGDVRATLTKLQGDTPVAGTLTITRQTREGEGAKARHSGGSLTLDVAAARGLRMHVPAATLVAAARERAAAQANPELPTPVADLLDAIGPVQVQRMLDVAANLQRTLGDAKLLKQTSTTLDAAPAQLLTLDLPLRASKSDRSKIKSYHAQLSLWLNAQGVPLAWTTITRTEVGWLLLHAEFERSESVRLAVVGTRLVATTLVSDQRGSGLGQHGETKTTYTLRLATSPSTESTDSAADASAHPAQGG